MKELFYVSIDDYEKANKSRDKDGNYELCAVEASLRRALSRDDIFADYSYIRIGNQQIRTPKKAASYMRGFDIRLPDIPFEFQLSL